MTTTIETGTFNDPDAVFNKNRRADELRPGELPVPKIVKDDLSLPDGETEEPARYTYRPTNIPELEPPEDFPQPPHSPATH